MNVEKLPQDLLRKIFGNGPAGKAGIGEQRIQGALEIPDMRADPSRNQVSNRFFQKDVSLLRLVHQDGDAGFKVRRLDGNGQAPPETGSQARLDTIDLLGITVTRKDYLLLTVQQGIESMEKLFLGAILAGEKLDIVDQ